MTRPSRPFERQPTSDLHGRTVGIVGFGGNGRRLAEVAALMRASIRVGTTTADLDALAEDRIRELTRGGTRYIVHLYRASLDHWYAAVERTTGRTPDRARGPFPRGQAARFGGSRWHPTRGRRTLQRDAGQGASQSLRHGGPVAR